MAHDVNKAGFENDPKRYWKHKTFNGEKEFVECNPAIITIEPQILQLLAMGISIRSQEFEDVTHKPTGKAVLLQGIAHRWSALEAYKRLKDINHVIEIGVSYGNNAWKICTLLKPKTCALIDPYLTVPENVITKEDECANDVPYNMAKLTMGSLPVDTTFHKKKSSEAFSELPDGYFDFIFVDGDHSYEGCLEDIKNYFPKLKKGGIMAGDDYHKDGVKPAVDKYFKSYEVSPNGFEWLVTKGV